MNKTREKLISVRVAVCAVCVFLLGARIEIATAAIVVHQLL